MNDDLVLVTGGSGFVGVHCIDQLLRSGYRVRTTLRSLSREADVRAMLQEAGSPRQETLTCVTADLTNDTGWDRAVAGCRYVLHVASPFPAAEPKHEDELIVPAREGTLRVLRAARDAGVKRVVFTSSFAAVGYGHPPQAEPFDEYIWTNLDGKGITAYVKSKTLAERAAWNFIQKEGGSLELSTINPVGIFGPALGPDYSTSVTIIQKLLDGFPFCPHLYMGAVDVRDVADLHLRAMTNPQANGQRFLAVAGKQISMLEAATVLKMHLGNAARRTPQRELPDWLVKMLAPLIPGLTLLVPELSKQKNASHAKASSFLGWMPRSNEESIVATGQSLIRLGLVKQ